MAACPTCSGLGSVMSPESVAIETFRQIRALGTVVRAFQRARRRKETGRARDRRLCCAERRRATGVLVRGRDDESATGDRGSRRRRRRCGDASREDARRGRRRRRSYRSSRASASATRSNVDVLHARLPNPTSALAVVGNRLVEVENAANAAGQSIRIKIIDVDEDGNILAEPRTPAGAAAVAAAADGRRRRRRGGRGRRKPLTAAEQTQELRELAEEAARGLGGRTAAIGISTAAEAEREAETTPARRVPPLTVVSQAGPPASYFGEPAARTAKATAVAAGGAVAVGVRVSRRGPRRDPGAERRACRHRDRRRGAAEAESRRGRRRPRQRRGRRDTPSSPASPPPRSRWRGRRPRSEVPQPLASSPTVRSLASIADGGAPEHGRVAPPEPSRAVAAGPGPERGSGSGRGPAAQPARTRGEAKADPGQPPSAGDDRRAAPR